MPTLPPRPLLTQAMPMLGLDVSAGEIDKLFDRWDKDGGGSLDFKELQKVLRPPEAKAATAARAVLATRKMQKEKRT